jgi:LCP family protein required for cell wall assembly
MFHELDDPTPPTFDDGMRRQVRARVRARRQRRLAVGGAAGAVVLATGGLYARAATRLGDVERIELAGTASVAPGEPRTILLVGTDTAAGLVGAEPTTLADTIVLVRVDGDRVRLLSLPRDLEVVDPQGTPVRLNSILTSDGVGGLIAVIEQQVGLPVDHVAMVDFGGFRDLVDRIGGIELATSVPVRDLSSGLELSATGCQRLSGSQALALVRARHLEFPGDAGWIADTSGDLGRMDRQRAFLIAALTAVQRQVPDPLTVDQLAGWAVGHLTIDAELDVATLTELLRLGLALDPTQVDSYTLPVVPAVLDSGANVLRVDAGAPSVLARFHGATPAPGPPPRRTMPTIPAVEITPC